VIGAAIIGCGAIAPTYAAAVQRSGRLRLVAATSRRVESAEALVVEYGGIAYLDVDTLLRDRRVELVINLTSPSVHAEITGRCLDAGKHVYSEKPLALSAAEARELVARAYGRGVGLGVAPSSFLAAPQQAAIEAIRAGIVGRVRAVRCDARWGRIEQWHRSPEALFESGPVADVAPYPLTLVTQALGPVERATAQGIVALPRRRRLDGRVFEVRTADHVDAVLELAGGQLVQLTASFFASTAAGRGQVEFVGDDGVLVVDSSLVGDSGVSVVTDSAVRSLDVSGSVAGIDFGLGLEDLAKAIEAGTLAPADGPAHIASVVEAIHRAIRTRRTEWIQSFEREW
jgi:predicted dehydrogenase